MNSLKLTATLNRKDIRSGRKATLYLLLDIEAVPLCVRIVVVQEPEIYI